MNTDQMKRLEEIRQLSSPTINFLFALLDEKHEEIDSLKRKNELLIQTIEYQQAKVEKLREAGNRLRDAGNHQVGCRPTAYSQDKQCSCGWAQALADTENLGGPAANIEPQSNTSRQNADSEEEQ